MHAKVVHEFVTGGRTSFRSADATRANAAFRVTRYHM